MTAQIRPALLLLLVLTLLTGIVYPLVITGVAQAIFPAQANGSLIERDGEVVGSRLIGQSFDDPRYFWGHLSGTGPAYHGGASSGSNYGPMNTALRDAAQARATALRETDPGNHRPIPVDLLTASGTSTLMSSARVEALVSGETGWANWGEGWGPVVAPPPGRLKMPLWPPAAMLAVRIASSSSSIVWKRRAGSFSRQRITTASISAGTGMYGRSELKGGGASLQWEKMSSR